MHTTMVKLTYQIVAEMANIPRSQAKTINLGFFIYGKNKLQAELGISKEEADALFRTYHDKVPFVKMLMEVYHEEHKIVVRLERY